MAQNNKPAGALILAGLAAFAYYKYSKLSEDKKRKLTDDIKEQGQKLYDQYAPPELKEFLTKKQAQPASHFGEGESYTG